MVLTETEAEAEKEKARAWIQFLIQTYTAPSFGTPDPAFEMQKKEFMEAIQPKPQISTEQPKKFEWDFEKIDKYKAQQEGGKSIDG